MATLTCVFHVERSHGTTNIAPNQTNKT